MKNYEALFVLKAEKDEEVAKTVTSITDVIAKNKGKIIKEDKWGKRPIAYRLKKQREGVYYKLNFSAAPSTIRNMEGAYKLNPSILRTMVVQRDPANQ